jgi:hypothetical protein
MTPLSRPEKTQRAKLGAAFPLAAAHLSQRQPNRINKLRPLQDPLSRFPGVRAVR